MHEIAPNVYHVPGAYKSRFPYCSCLYLKGKKLSVLIDAGMGRENLKPVMEHGLDLLILTHCHIDHRLTRRLIPDTPVWCHEKEARFLEDRSLFFAGLGWGRGGYTLEDILPGKLEGIEFSPQKTLTDGEEIDLGGLTLVAIHTPGHTPGHTAFYIPEVDLLFAGDVDLTSFGPYYGHSFADISTFEDSIERLKKLKAGTILTGHAGPFSDELERRFDEFAGIIVNRDRFLLEELAQPHTPQELVGRRLIFPKYPKNPDHIFWAERIHIEKQLERLTSMGLARRIEDRYVRTNGVSSQ